MRHRPRSPLELSAGPEQRDHRCLHGRCDVHRCRVDADEYPRFTGDRGKLAQAELAGQIDQVGSGGERGLRDDRIDQAPFGGIRRAGDDDSPSTFRQPIGELRIAFRRPALEQPARSWMKVDETPRLDAMLLEARFSCRAKSRSCASICAITGRNIRNTSRMVS